MCGCVNPTPVNARRGGAVRSRSLSCTAPLNVNVPGLLYPNVVCHGQRLLSHAACSLLPLLSSAPSRVPDFPLGARESGEAESPRFRRSKVELGLPREGTKTRRALGLALDNDDEQASQISDPDPQHFTFSNGGARSKEHSIGRV